jgi:CxxC motif-containing protein
MSMTELICITCPIGCRLEVEKKYIKGRTTYSVRGHTCKRGEKYAIEEMTCPTRMVTTTVRIEGGTLPRIPVKTSAPIPKEKVFECMRLLNDVRLFAPIKCGDKVIENVMGLNIHIVASRSLEKISKE